MAKIEEVMRARRGQAPQKWVGTCEVWARGIGGCGAIRAKTMSFKAKERVPLMGRNNIRGMDTRFKIFCEFLLLLFIFSYCQFA